MAQTLIVLDRQAVAKAFSFGTTSASGEGLVTINKGTAANSTVVLDVKASANIAGDLNLVGNLNITGTVNTQSVTNTNVQDITITLNDGGTTPADNTSGIIIEGTTNTIATAIYFNSAAATKWSFSTGGDAVGTTATQTLTNKSISGGQITSAVANATLAATVTTNANLTGPITSSGNATSVAAQTGTGTTFVMQASPTLTTPVIGVATGTSLSVTGSLSTGVASTTAGDVVWRNATNAFTQTFRGSNPAGANIVYVLPSTAPTAGQVLSSGAPSAGVATMSWADAGSASTITISDDTSTNAVMYPVWTTATSGSVAPKVTSTKLNFNPSTGVLTSTSFTGAGTGLTGTASSLTAGVATNTTITDDVATSATMYLTWVTAATGNLPQKVSSTKFTVNPATGVLSATSFTGAGTGLTGTAASLTAGAVTTNANLTGDVTSSGNATTLASYMKACTVTGTQDSSNKVFTIGTAVKAGSEMVHVNGQLLTPGSSNDYVISGTTVTFQAAFTAPAATDVIRIYGVFI